MIPAEDGEAGLTAFYEHALAVPKEDRPPGVVVRDDAGICLWAEPRERLSTRRRSPRGPDHAAHPTPRPQLSPIYALSTARNRVRDRALGC